MYIQTDPFTKDKHDYSKTTMEVNGLKAVFNMPKAKKRKKNSKGEEVSFGLPEYNPRPAFPVDDYPACPAAWLNGSSKASSYFVPTLPEHGMWIDLTQNSQHEHDVAAVVSIQGVNPLTGVKSDPIRLEQYKTKCPKHDIEFQQDRFCSECKFKWHPQNYLCSNNGSVFWIDGFRSEDGTVRQWYFTEEECKGVAAQIIGDERVFAIGIAFYLSKKPKPKPEITYSHTYGYWNPIMWYGSGYPPLDGNIYNNQMLGSFDAEISCSLNSGCSTTGASGFIGATGPTGSSGVTGSSGPQGPSGQSKKKKKIKTSRRSRLLGAKRAKNRGQKSLMNKSIPTSEVDVYATNFVGALQADVESTQMQLEIGAGAKIQQKINPDPQDLDYWQEEPAGFIYINYCDVDTASKILKAGKREELMEGFLANMEIKDLK